MSARSMIREQLDLLWDPVSGLFDAHAHTGADIDGTVRSAEEHVADLAAVGGRSVIFPLCVRGGYAAENRRIIREARRYSERLVPFARLDPNVDDIAEAEQAIEEGARGFKLHPRGESFGLEHPNVDEFLGLAAEARIPFLIHAGRGVGSFGPVLTELASRHRSCPIILAHAAISDLAWLGYVADQHPNLFFDTAWWNPADLLALFSLVRPGQILHGSDAPYGDVELNLVLTLRCARVVGLSDEQVALVTGAQLERLLAAEPAANGGAAPGAPRRTTCPENARLTAYLTAARGALLGGGQPQEMLALALCAIGSRDGAGGAPEDMLIRELVTAIDWSHPAAVRNALVLALTFAATRGLETRATAGRVSKAAGASRQPAAGRSHLGAEVRGHDHQGGPR